ncbi:MAG: hypothetical protein MUC36_27775 [Planctomycetes bacterium]|jgi:hypothetical protein|nr:hypothetical protein [Planctomycetota bacterium]
MHETSTPSVVLRLLLATAVGAVLGGFCVWLARAEMAPGPAPLVDRPELEDVAAGPPRSPTPAPSHQAESASAPSPAAPPREDAALLSAALRAYAAAEIAAGWREVRSDDVPVGVAAAVMERFEATVRSQPRALGRSAGEDLVRAEAKAARFAGDDLTALLSAIEGDEPEAQELVRSERFPQLLAPRGGGGVVDGTRLQRGEAVAAGTVLSFPAGVFQLHDLGQATRGGDWAFPRDVVVRGAGMDVTLLRFDEQTSRGPMQRFAIENCTVFADGLTDLRADAPAALSLRNVRLVGFDTGAGGSAAFYLGGGSALLAVSCRFESGYGRHPTGYANLLRGRGPCLARFERCVLERCSLDDADGVSVLFVDCSLLDMLGDQPAGPTFRNCRYTNMPAEQVNDPEYRRRDLNALFPDWQRRLEQR